MGSVIRIAARTPATVAVRPHQEASSASHSGSPRARRDSSRNTALGMRLASARVLRAVFGIAQRLGRSARSAACKGAAQILCGGAATDARHGQSGLFVFVGWLRYRRTGEQGAL